jgi:hypothetical protein
MEKYRLLQAKLQAKLHEMAAADAAATQAFTERRERMAKKVWQLRSSSDSFRATRPANR